MAGCGWWGCDEACGWASRLRLALGARLSAATPAAGNSEQLLACFTPDRAPELFAACPPQVVANWRSKLERVAAGEQKWGLFRAFKPKEGRDFHPPEVESAAALA